MSVSTWEDQISLNSRLDTTGPALGPPRDYVDQNVGEVVWDLDRIPLAQALAMDTAPLPSTEQREGYYGANHFNYWASGLRDYCQLTSWLGQNNVTCGTLLDIGCATGRLIRHARMGFSEVVGCDINRAHIDWIGRHLPSDVMAFQNSSIPTLPLPASSVDVISAFSVFTHVECFDTTWLMELRRILRPGGVAWLTIHGERTWRDIEPTWPLHASLSSHPDYPGHRANASMPQERLVFRWHAERSYSAHVFYTENYIRRTWGRILAVKDIFPTLPFYQDIVVLQKI
jgi:SAM-dependent methyltransferase